MCVCKQGGGTGGGDGMGTVCTGDREIFLKKHTHIPCRNTARESNLHSQTLQENPPPSPSRG